MTQTFPVAPISGIRDRRDLAAFYLNLSRTGGDIVAYRAGGRPAFLINRPEHARFVLSTNQDKYRNPHHPYAELAGFYQAPGAALLRLSRPDSGALARTAEEVVAVATETAQRLRERSRTGPVQIDVEAKIMTFRIITRILFGIDPAPLAEAFVRAVSLIEECSANHLFANGRAVADPLYHHYQEALALQDRTAGWLAHAAKLVPASQPAPAGLIITLVRTLLNGYNATATTFCWMIYQLTRNTTILERLYEEIDQAIGKRHPTIEDLPRLGYTRLVIMETLRLYPPAWIIGREALAAHRIGTTAIPAGAVISVSAYTMQRHTRFWERPGEFVPERFAPQLHAQRHSYTYFPFGGGARRCPAGHRMVGHLQLLLAVFLQQCRIEAPLHQHIRPRGLIALRPHPGVWARFTARD